MKIAVKTLGCKLNQAEGDKIIQELVESGFEIVDFKNKADIYIINACSVTAVADRKAQLVINNFKNKNSKAKIVLTGCFSKKPSKVDLVIKDKNILIKNLLDKYPPINKSKNKSASKPANQKTRVFVKIQDGCDNFCSYCIIPLMRGLPQSIRVSEIVKEINKKVEQGFKEIVLTGVNICKYKSGQLDLAGLVKNILRETEVKRIRFGSIDPKLITDEFINLFDNKRICNHLHLSLQSGSNSVLKRMNRKHTTKDFLDLISKIKKKYSLFGLTTDIIVGYPGETEEEFKETCDFVKKIGFQKIHVFPFSKRPGTVAEKLDDQIDLKTKKLRAHSLKEISEELNKRFRQKIRSKEFEVLFENKINGKWVGFTDNYIKVEKRGDKNWFNRIITIKF